MWNLKTTLLMFSFFKSHLYWAKIYRKLTIWGYESKSFDKGIQLCNRHHKQHLFWSPRCSSKVSPIVNHSPQPSAWQPLIWFLSVTQPFPECHIDIMMQYVTCGVWRLPLATVLSGLIKIAASIHSSLLLISEQYLIVLTIQQFVSSYAGWLLPVLG